MCASSMAWHIEAIVRSFDELNSSADVCSSCFQRLSSLRALPSLGSQSLLPQSAFLSLRVTNSTPLPPSTNPFAETYRSRDSPSAKRPLACQSIHWASFQRQRQIDAIKLLVSRRSGHWYNHVSTNALYDWIFHWADQTSSGSVNNYSVWGTGSLDAGCGRFNFTVSHSTSNSEVSAMKPIRTSATGTPVLLSLASTSTSAKKPTTKKPVVRSTAMSDSMIFPVSGASLLGVALIFCFL